jgi:hypothetical protein
MHHRVRPSEQVVARRNAEAPLAIGSPRCRHCRRERRNNPGGETMRQITATLLAPLMIAGQAAAQTALVSLVCEGTVKNFADETLKSGPDKMWIGIGLEQHRVLTEFVPPTSHITRLDDAVVEFSGETSSIVGSSFVMGTINRVNGAASVRTVYAGKDGKILLTQFFDLVCRGLGRLFP